MIEINNFSFCYPKKQIFDHASFQINGPGIYMLEGENGEGKTTLLNYIASKYDCSYCLQDSYLLDFLTVREHFDLFEVDLENLSLIRLENKKDCYKDELSDGERQRIATILALFSSDIVLLDEPFSNLDKLSREMMIDIIKSIKNKIIIITSHISSFDKKDIKGIIKIRNKKVLYRKKHNEMAVIEGNAKQINIKTMKAYYRKNIIDRVKVLLLYTLGIVFLLATFIVKDNITSDIDKDKNRALEINKYYLMDNYKNPSEEIIDNYDYKYNYDYLFNYLYDRDDFHIIDNKNVSLKEGRYPASYLEVITSDEYSLNDEIEITSNALIGLNEIDIYNETITLKVEGISYNLHFYEQDGVYLDYRSWDEYFDSHTLINNDLSLKCYYQKLDIGSYKYLVFEDASIDSKYLQGKLDDYYKEIDKIKIKVGELANTIAIFTIVMFLYNLLRYINKCRRLERENVSYLIKNSFSFSSVFRLMYAFDLIAIFAISAISLLYFNSSYLIHLIIYFVLTCLSYLFILLEEVHYAKNR